jgi:hypothetical protein
VRTTDSDHPFPRNPNLVESLEVKRPDQAWVEDITHVYLRKEFVYLAVRRSSSASAWAWSPGPDQAWHTPAAMSIWAYPNGTRISAKYTEISAFVEHQ